MTPRRKTRSRLQLFYDTGLFDMKRDERDMFGYPADAFDLKPLLLTLVIFQLLASFAHA